MVSRAFQVLSDSDKKSKYDKFGGDPDSRQAQASSASSPFSGFARSQGPGGPNASMFEEEISPEELFRQFFGGGIGGGFPGFGRCYFVNQTNLANSLKLSKPVHSSSLTWAGLAYA